MVIVIRFDESFLRRKESAAAWEAEDYNLRQGKNNLEKVKRMLLTTLARAHWVILLC